MDETKARPAVNPFRLAGIDPFLVEGSRCRKGVWPMRFFELHADAPKTVEGELWIIDVPTTYKVGDVWLGDCKRIEKWDEMFVGTYPNTRQFIANDFLDAHYPIVSAQFREFLEEWLPAEIQFLPIRLIANDGTAEVTGYSFAQVLIALDCIDQKRTPTYGQEWKRGRNGNFNMVLLAHELRLRLELIRNHQIFRVAGFSPVLVVRQDLKEAIEAKGFTGCLFEPMKVSR